MNQYDYDQVNRLEPGYLAEHGLSEAPFSSQHDDAYLYVDAERAQRLNMLSHLTQYSNLLLIVTGERGIGKTSLMRRYINEAEDNWRICEVNAHTMMDAETLLSEIAVGFGLPGMSHDVNQQQDIVFTHLKSLQDDDEIPILLIDDAHELPKEALETLFYFADIEAAQGHLLRIILFCEPQIEIMLEAPAIRPLRERITHTMDIPAFEEEQTAEYIKHRMAVAGFEGNSPFTPKVIKKLHRISRGIPSHINELAHLHLNDSSSSGLDEPVEVQQKTNERTFSHRQIALGSIIIIIAVLALTLQDNINQLFEDDKPELDVANKQMNSADTSKPEMALETNTTPMSEMVLKEKPPAADSNTETKRKPKADAVAPTAEKKSVKNQAIFADPTGETVSSDNAPQAEMTEPVADEPELAATAKRIEITSIKPAVVKGSKQPQTLTLTGTGFLPADGIKPDVNVSWTGKNNQPVVRSLKSHQVKIIDDNKITISVTTGINPDTWSVSVKAGKQQSKPVNFSVEAGTQIKNAKDNRDKNVTGQKPVVATTTYQPAGNWIMSRDPNHFTLQLLGTQSRKSLESFMRKHRLTGDVSIYKTLRDGKDWYALVYGAYNNKQAARQAVQQLPKSLGKVKPWIRRFDSVQAQIVTETKTIKVTRPPLAKTTSSKQNHVAWLWSQSPSSFTLQLLGSRNESAIKQFIKKHKLIGQAKYFYTRYDTRNWYTLVYGVYPNRAAATQAIKDLPPALQKVSPWARSFASIHKDLHQSSVQSVR